MPRLAGCIAGLTLALTLNARQPARAQADNTRDSAAPVPLPAFRGTLKGVDRKGLTLEVEDGNLLQLQCSRKTRFFVNSKAAKPSAFHPGDRVSVETRRELNGELEAVNVRLEERKP